MKIKYLVKSFENLSNKELYRILKLRADVFVVEQQCIYQDLDDKDESSYHLMLLVDDKLAGYTRLLPAGISYPEPSIGRVIIGKPFRGLKLGRQLMEKSIQACQQQYHTSTIRIGAQLYLKNFYNSLGFVQEGQQYDEDGIPHIQMVRK
ncbi:ElaA protein [Arachidicoccus rhizosphaerae]|uniref:ElaA protein n=1 Tax=Arachidicoccus rhizosphaerae TaxID=551991 RepID=A0A1H3YJM6_9BACT|nr:GNAT family N-acetyltransferase [Arachidicoccus rhizosphaerae]SEA11693.1 ElaA protein [Arachidicoccus rhizosphaerae]